MTKIKLSNRPEYFYIDGSDTHLLESWKWGLHSGYVARLSTTVSGRRKWVFLHRLIMDPPDGLVVDHINGDVLDNRRSNLRVCTRNENWANRKKQTPNPGKSRFKGVTQLPSGRWYAVCRANNCTENRYGTFNTEEEAAHAFDRFAVELFGDFARLNFPRSA